MQHCAQLMPERGKGSAQQSHWLPSHGSSASHGTQTGIGTSLRSSHNKQCCLFFNQM
ncbi:hypothetical protein ALP86_101863 [Pseudomonas amygdali pv. mori]|uniref:Uncharacterized protein n=1 Tax=Pseudomonas savastanoi TaxID=29438 RepID=A0A3M5GME1_PSESS|nr:hypothetical protein ALO82_101808 [Pseudomonas syringae pv. broussonetiae]RMR48390.1 hypothetical protein ALP86_101863 [Pseudomonas amygdali pv. mori]RMS87802.1 hypothetical protein ALP60_101892 [Pseudomonas savastanoi]